MSTGKDPSSSSSQSVDDVRGVPMNPSMSPSSGRIKGVFEILMSPNNNDNKTSTPYNPEKTFHRPVEPTSISEYGFGQLTTGRHLPYFMPWSIQTGRSLDLPPDFTWLSNSCGGRAAIGVIGGGAMGLLMGVFLGAMSDATPPVQVIAGKDVPQAPLREQIRVTWRATASKSLYWCRNFAFISGVFGGSECLVEKYRAKHDVWNAVTSGCLTGAALQAKSGPQAAAVGCAGFAAFSLVIDSVMGHN